MAEDLRPEQVQRLNQAMISALALFSEAGDAGKVAEGEMDRILKEYLLVAKQIENSLLRIQQPKSQQQALKQEISAMEEELRAKEQLIQTYAAKIKQWESQIAAHNEEVQATLLGQKPPLTPVE